ncbi:MAG: ABC transporter substrate-binding protein [Chloroflexi bacterium]|nr:ABC transporter substrate-binding protein [Chloroflexota bacterium]MCL5108054.1 ABC transporter substrate-binding protein [Chloroflexota bacterium]
MTNLANRLSRRQFVASLAALAGAGALAACGTAQPAATPAATSAPKPAATLAPAAAATQAPAQATKPAAAAIKKGGTYRLGRVQDVINFNPTQLSQGNEPFFYQVFDTLVRIGDDFKIEPRLAESWSFSPDNLTVTIKLRQGVKFHNGHDFTAEDVLGTIAFYADKANSANILPFASSIKNPKAVDKNTVELHFAAPPATLFDGLDLLYIIDPTDPGGLKNKPNGTGPFQFDRWQPNDKSIYKRFAQFRQQGIPYLDSLEVSVWPDPQAMVIALETGSIDMASPVSPLEAKRLAADAKYQLTRDKLGLVFDVIMNTTIKPFDDKRVRQAVSWAIDRQRFCDTYNQGLVQPWSLPWPPYSPAYDADLNQTYNKRDVAKAKQLLKDAGYENGFDVKMLATRSRPGYTELAEQLQSDLKDAGIRVTLDIQDEAAWRPKFIDGNFQMATHTFGRNNKVPASMFEQAVVWRPDKNSAQFKSDQFTSLTKQASSTMDQEKAKPIYKQINQLIIDECFTLTVAPQPRPSVEYKYSKGFQSNLDSYPMFESTWLDK